MTKRGGVCDFRWKNGENSWEVSTGIDDIVISDRINRDSKVYTISGQYVGESLDGLKKGIYIQNGKKIVVK